MFGPNLGLPGAAWLLPLLLLDPVAAVPGAAIRNGDSINNKHYHAVAPIPRQVQTPANPTDLWVTVDESGKPKTVTPVLTTISGTPTVVSGAPYEVTGSVFTTTNDRAVKVTTTGGAQATATGANGGGAFALCKNGDGDFKPFCEPKNNSTLYPGESPHYITWDPSSTLFNHTNTTTNIRVIGFYNDNRTDEAFSSEPMAAGWGFYQWSVNDKLLSAKHTSAVNITIGIAALPAGAQAVMQWLPGPTVVVMHSPSPPPVLTPNPEGAALYIALPLVLGFVCLVLVGTCVFNRKARHIGLGNVMGRARGRGGYGVGKSRRQRMFGGGKNSAAAEQNIRLMDRDGQGPGQGQGAVYRDEPLRDNSDEGWRHEVPGRGKADEGRPRRDSDALGSMAGTPTSERQFDFSRPGGPNLTNTGGSNVFRQELSRQEKERF